MYTDSWIRYCETGKKKKRCSDDLEMKRITNGKKKETQSSNTDGNFCGSEFEGDDANDAQSMKV